MIKLKDILNEGVYDKAALKAVIMAGGPGSGKTTISKELFGFDTTLNSVNLSSSGMKRMDLDYFFTRLLKKRGYDLDLSDMEKMNHLNKTVSPDAISQYDKQKDMWIANRMGIILDTTSANIEKVKTNKKRLEDAGYDVICVFIDTPLEVALHRNRNRDRKLPDELVTRMWQDCENNKENFKSIFGSSLYIVKDDDIKSIQSSINRFLGEPIRNPIGRKWIQTQLDMKDRR